MKTSDNLNDLEGDITNLSTLVGVIVDMAVESDTERQGPATSVDSP